MPFDGRTSGSEVHGCRSLWHCGPSLGFQVSFCVAFQTDVSRKLVAVADDYVPHDDLLYSDNPGISSSVSLTTESLPIEFVNLFFTEEIVSKIVTETNMCAEQFFTEK